MDNFGDEIPTADLQKFENAYNEQLKLGKITNECQFQYAYCLVKSKFGGDIRKGIMLLEELFINHPEGRRDYLFYLAVGNSQIKEYTKALDFCRKFLQIEPNNLQVQALEKDVREKLSKAGKTGMLAAGGGLLIAVGAAFIGGALLSRK